MKKKNKLLTDIIAEKVGKRPKVIKAQTYLARVIAMADEIQDAINKGWKLAIIHETLQELGRFDGTYHSFRIALQQANIEYKRKKKALAPPIAAPASGSAPKEKSESPAPEEKKKKGPIIASVELKQFKHNKEK